jgi:hypothetical protein
VRCVGLLLLAAAALTAPPIAALGGQQTNGGALVLRGTCAAGDIKACTSCEIALARDRAAPIGDRTLTGACPKMMAGHYRLAIAVPVALVPAQPAAPIFAQLQAAFGATARDDASGRARAVLPETAPASWNWWGLAGAVIGRTLPVTLARDSAVDVAVTLGEARYFIPRRTQGPARRDGRLVVHKGTLVRLQRVPAPGEDHGPDLGTPREFGAKTLADIVPGHTTKAQVRALLGEPWRTVAPDSDEAEPEIWEYRGKDASGLYRIHIEFDDRGRTALLVKVPDKTHEAQARAAKTPAGPDKP